MQGRLLSRAFAAIARHNTSSDSRSLLKGIHGRCQGFSSQSELCREPPVLLVRVLEGAGVRAFSTTPSLFPKIVQTAFATTLCKSRMTVTSCGSLRMSRSSGGGTVKCHPFSTVSLAENARGVVREISPLVRGGETNQRRVGIWLLGCTGWVFSMVVLGGVTRLTRSGLSMTDWKFAGGLPPLTVEQWQMEFLKYQNSPEYKRVNKGMSLDQFKFIYWMEYAHRMWGRALGVVFAGPFAYFLVRGYITKRLALRLSTLMTMGATQGLVGWWMVKSGLEEPETEYVQPRVSPYRLAAHLTSAFVIYSGLLWTALSVMLPYPQLSSGRAPMIVRNIALPVAALVGITAVSGAFVAGNDAGHAYNTFPKMGDHWLPEGLMEMKPFFRNFFENTATVQLQHRILAMTTLISITGMWVATRRLPVEPQIRLLLNATLGMATLQVTLGISTLLTYVPASLGAAHQAGALTLFTIVLALMHSLRRPLPTNLATAQLSQQQKSLLKAWK
ncbi:hypothetical protein BDL97_15G066900 [Sphagnum fallax]|nr:hypothetical protein BDL97_15G066900 [Sphagnum fallax]KAH8940038.1 hypothetical protein BDL97_15G066900 [Sphagnum fallax]